MVWLVPTMLVMGCMMTADVVLSMLARTTKRREAREQQQVRKVPMPAGNAPCQISQVCA